MKQLLSLGVVALFGLPLAAEPTTKYPPLKPAVSSFGAAVCDGYLYVYGGHIGSAHAFSNKNALGIFRRLRLEGSNTWEELPGGPSMQGLAMVAHSGKLYRIGGTQARNDPGEPTDMISLSSFAGYDPATKKWTDLPDLPQPRSSHDAVVQGDRIYVVGGWAMGGKGNKPVWHDTALVYDLAAANPEWQTIPQPFVRRALIAATHEGKVYVVGGMTEVGELKPFVNIYDPASKKWSKGPDLPGNRMNGFSPAACVFQGSLVVNPSDGTLYRLADDEWVPAGEVRENRFVHRIIPIKEGIVVVGGASRKGTVGATELVLPESKQSQE